MKNKIYSLLYIPLLATAFLQGCTPQRYYVPDYHRTGVNTASVVSSHHPEQRTKQYLTEREARSYEDALVEAQAEEFAGDVEKEVLLSDQHLLKSLEVDRKPAVLSSGLGPLWGTPPGALAQGVTLLDESLRKRLNDALQSTPLSGEARWTVGYHQFVFMPNGEIYHPYRTGGSCRDGVFIHYGGAAEEKVRGLFCKQGQGGDWYLVR